MRIEKNVDRMASVLFAAACGYSTRLWFAGELLGPVTAVATVAAALFAYQLSTRVLGAVRPEPPRLPVPIFDVRKVEPMDPGELPFANQAELEDRCDVSPTSFVEPNIGGEEPLLLDDMLPEPSSNSRVVRLFDPSAMPAGGELSSQIDKNLEGEASAARSQDAAQALHDALAELRRSLR